MISYYFFVIRFPRSRLESLLWLSYTSCRKDARSLGLCVGSRSVSKQANFPFLFCGLKNHFWHKRSKTEMSLSKDLSIALSLILKSKTVFSHSIALNLVPGSHFRRRNISCQNKTYAPLKKVKMKHRNQYSGKNNWNTTWVLEITSVLKIVQEPHDSMAYHEMG